jgi:hypothetical protein
VPMVLHRILRAPRVSGRLERTLAATRLAARWGSPVVLLGGRSSPGQSRPRIRR